MDITLNIYIHECSIYKINFNEDKKLKHSDTIIKNYNFDEEFD